LEAVSRGLRVQALTSVSTNSPEGRSKRRESSHRRSKGSFALVSS